MAIDFKRLTGKNYHIVVQKSGVDFVAYNSSYEAYGTSSRDISDYGIEATEVSDSGLFTVTMPSGSAIGSYVITVYEQLGGSPAVGDINRNAFLYNWSGTEEVILSAIQATVDTLSTDITIASITAGVWDEQLTAGTHNVTDSAGLRVRSSEAKIDTVTTDVGAVDAKVVTVDLVVDTIVTDITLDNIADAVWDEVITVGAFNITDSAGKRLREIDAVVPLIGTGAIEHTYTVTDGVNPIEGVGVWVTTDIGGSNVVAGTLTTDVSGVVTFMLDAATYYFWSQKAGYNFTNPDAEAVA